MATPKDVIAMAKESGAADRRLPVLRPAGADAALLHPGLASSPRTSFEDGLGFDGSLDPRVPGDPGVGHAPGARPRHRVHGPVHEAPHAEHQLLREGPGDRRGVLARPAQHRAQGRAVPEADRHRRHARTGVPRPSSTSSTRSASTRTSTRATTTSTRSRACGTRAGKGEDGRPNLGYKPRYKEGYFPLPPMDQYQDLRSEMVLNLEKVGHHDRGAPPRGRHRRARPRSTCATTRCSTTADNVMKYKYVVKNTAYAGRQDRDVHAEAAVQGQRLGHAHPPVACGRTTRTCSGTRSATRGISDMARWYIGGLHRPRALAARVHEPDDELLPPARAGLRGADQPRVLAAEPQRVRADPAVLEEPGRQAPRVPHAGPVVQPVPGVRAMLMAGPRRHQEQDRAARARSTRTCTTCRPRSTRR